MKKTIGIIIGVITLAIGISLLVVSCGQQATTSSSSSSSSSSTITLSGLLAEESSSDSKGIKNKGATDFTEVTVVVIDNETNQTFRASADATGNFSIDNLPADGTYTVSLIDTGDSTYGVPIVFDGSGSTVNTAIAPSSDTDLGTVTIYSDDSYAKTANAPASVDTTITAFATNGVPKGAGNNGKTVISSASINSVTLVTGSDKDQDGIPNLYDGDEDNDGKPNGTSVVQSTKTVSGYSSNVESVYMSSNIWADHADPLEAKELIALRLHVVPQTGKETNIASVQCSGVPASISSVAEVRLADSLGAPNGYPTEGSLWSASSYGLYKTTTLSPEQWIISIRPNEDMSVGEFFTIKVTYTDATYEEFDLTIAYVLTDWARITMYNNVALPDNEGTKSLPVVTTEDSTQIEFAKPLDENGAILQGLTYSVIYGESTQGGNGKYSVPITTTTISVPDTPLSTTLSALIPTPTDGTTYYITPVAESADGQRNGAETWCTKQ